VFEAKTHFAVLFPNNMVGSRSEMLAIGGFDERMRISAEDNDYCYRWLRAGRPMRFEPDLVVWHDDWRTTSELDQLYVRYAVGQGMLYAKYIWRGDQRMIRYVVRDLNFGIRRLAARIRDGEPAVPHWSHGILRGLPRGFLHGLVVFRPRLSSRARG